MRRNGALIPLTHDHHHGLAHARRLRKSAAEGPQERAEQARRFLGFFEQEAIAHFREEEEAVFPLVIDRPEARDVLVRLLLDHVRMHALVARLRAALEDGRVPAELVGSIGETLEAHIRAEEKQAFPLIETLASDALAGLVLAPRERKARAAGMTS